MERSIQTNCAKEFYEQAAELSRDDPNAALIEARRFSSGHDTAEFTTQQRMVISCRLAGCTVVLTSGENGPTVDSPACIRSSRTLTN